MTKVTCPVCETKFEISQSVKPGGRFSCPHCFAQLALRKIGKEHKAVCAICKSPTMDCKSCDELEIRRTEKDLI